MEEILLRDKSEKPNDNIIFSIIGDAELLWSQFFSYLSDRSKDITRSWEYSDCGKYWVCIVRKKKNTLFRLRIFKRNSFGLAFPFGDKSEPMVLQSELPDIIKHDFIDARRYNSTRYISIEVEEAKDVEIAMKLIDIKIDN